MEPMSSVMDSHMQTANLRRDQQTFDKYVLPLLAEPMDLRRLVYIPLRTRITDQRAYAFDVRTGTMSSTRARRCASNRTRGCGRRWRSIRV